MSPRYASVGAPLRRRCRAHRLRATRSNLGWLKLNKIGAAGLEALAASRNLPRLGYVGLATNAIPDPTPQHADEWDATSPVGEELQRKYGPRPWLDARPRWRWPPPRDVVE